MFAVARRLFDQHSEASTEVDDASQQTEAVALPVACHLEAARSSGRPASSSPSPFRFGVPKDERPIGMPSRSASYRVPSDSDTDDDEVQSEIQPIPRQSPLEQMVNDLQEQRRQAVSGEALRKHEQLRQQVEEIERQLAEGIQLAQLEIRSKQAALEVKEKLALEQHTLRRQQRLAELAAQHQQAAAVQQRHVARLQDEAKRKAEEAARQEAARQAAEARKAAEEADRKRKEEERRQAEEKAKRDAAAQQKQQQEQQAARVASSTAASTSGQPAPAAAAPRAAGAGPPTGAKNKALRISPGAQAAEGRLSEALAAAEAMVAQFKSSDAYKKQRRDIEKSITKFVQQIAASQQQVKVKSQDLQRLIQGCPDEVSCTYASLTLARKLISQAEVQVLRLPAFAFPLAMVAVAVATAYPPFMDHFRARLHQACILTVPKYYVYTAGTSEDEYFTKMGYKEVEAKGGGTQREATDDFAARVQGYLLLYGAVMQVEAPGNPLPVSQAWTFLAQALNALPANRLTATALEAFLKAAGYQLHRTYRSQFVKMLKYIDSHFLTDLANSKDNDAQAVSVRLRTYCHVGAFQKPPEGSQLPEFDESSYNRA